MTRNRYSTLLVIVVLTLLASCGGESEELNSEPESSVVNPYGGIEVPAPSPNERILKVANGGRVTEFSLNDLRELELVTETVFEPFVKQTITFVGVPLAVIFQIAEIQPSDEVITIALNEYIYTNIASEFTGTDAFLAFEQNGMPIAMDQGGPLRIIIPDNRPLTKNLDVWNWSLAEIRVE